MKKVKLTKRALDGMTSVEKKQCDKLEKQRMEKTDKMVKVQADYVIAFRKKTYTDLALRKLADKGFKAEADALDATDKHIDFMNKMNEKYKK
jgi:hypothetical protein